MATVGSSYMTMADVANASNARGDMLETVNMLAQVNPMLDHAPSLECNEGKQHRTSTLTGIPGGAWTAIYEGIAQEKSTRQQVTDVTARLEALSTVDTRLLNGAKNPAQIRLDEASAFLEGMAQTAAQALFYSTMIDSRKFIGLSPRFDDLSAPNGNQIVDGGGSGSDNCSVWMVTWSNRTCHLIHPMLSESEGSVSGIARKDMGVQRVLDASNNPYYVKEELFQLHTGICVRDWRFLVRIANIDVSELAAGNVDTLALMRKAYYRSKARVPMGGGGMINAKTCFYAPREFIEAYDADISDKSNVQLNLEQAGGVYAAASAYRRIPIYETDALSLAEAQVT